MSHDQPPTKMGILRMVPLSLSWLAFISVILLQRPSCITCSFLNGFRHGTPRSNKWMSSLPVVNNKKWETHSLGLSVSSSSSDIPLRVSRKVRPSVALVTPTGVRNMTSRGSGFVIDTTVIQKMGKSSDNSAAAPQDDYTFLLTAAHVAAPGTRITASIGDHINMTATVVSRNVPLDLALIRIQGKLDDVTPLQIATETPEVGSIAFCFGYPASRMRGPAMTSGIVCGIADGLGVPDGSSSSSRWPKENDNTTYVVTDAAMSGGMSGGPLVDTEGTVLGVNALIRPDLRALGNYAVSADEIRSFLENVILEDDDIEEGNNNSKVVVVAGYQVVLFNDPMNTRARVSKILNSVAALDDDVATKVMMQAHTTGQGVIQEYSDRGDADELCQMLLKEDILVEVQQIVE